MFARPLKLAIIGDGKMGLSLGAVALGHGFMPVALLGEGDVRPHGITKELLAGAEVIFNNRIVA